MKWVFFSILSLTISAFSQKTENHGSALFAMAIQEHQDKSSIPEVQFGVNNNVKIIMYYSPTCVHCAEYEKKAFPKLKLDFIDTGKIHFIMRPIAVHSGMDILAAQIAWNSNKPQEEPYNAEIFFKNMQKIMKFQDDWIIPFDRRTRDAFEKDLDAKVGRVAKSLKMEKKALRKALEIDEADPAGHLKLYALTELKMSVEDLKNAMDDSAVEAQILGNTISAVTKTGEPLDFTPAFYINGVLQDEVIDAHNVEDAIKKSMG